MTGLLSQFIDNTSNFINQLFSRLMLDERITYLKKNPSTKGNGFYPRSIFSMLGKINIQVPRTRDGEFHSEFLKQQSCDKDIEQMVRILYTGGLSQRKIEDYLQRIFGVSISTSTVSRLTQIAYSEICKWKMRPLESHYSVLFLDAFFFPLKRDTVENEAVYCIIGILPNGSREVLSYWIPGGSEGASNWREILQELRQRGLERADFIVGDGLVGLPQAVSDIFPQAYFQYCVVHATRTCLNKVRAGDKSKIADALKKIYRANNILEAKAALKALCQDWEHIYPKVTGFWKQHFVHLTNFMVLPKDLWKHVYTTNVIERLHKETKRRLKAMEQFPSEESADRILYLLMSERNKTYQNRRLNHWGFYYSLYLNERTEKLEEKTAI